MGAPGSRYFALRRRFRNSQKYGAGYADLNGCSESDDWANFAGRSIAFVASSAKEFRMQRHLASACCVSLAVAVAVGGALAGCERTMLRGQQATLVGYPAAPQGVSPWKRSVPTEKDKTSLPTYVVEPPDILLIDAVKVIPKSPYHLEPLDLLQIIVVGTLNDQPITGQFPIDPSGDVELGPAYGSVNIAGLTVDEAQAAVDKHLRRILRDPEVSITLSQSSGQQEIAGEHLVGPDGSVNLGSYGMVYVAGMTLDEAHEAIVAKLAEFLEEPQIAIDILAYNSKVYYIITEGAGLGDSVVRVPATGNETVLDAIANVNGLSRLSSKNVWIARPAAGGVGCDQILPVNWREISTGGATATNYQVLPGDRVFIAEDKWSRFDTFVATMMQPVNQLFGDASLTIGTVQASNRYPNGYAGGVP